MNDGTIFIASRRSSMSSTTTMTRRPTYMPYTIYSSTIHTSIVRATPDGMRGMRQTNPYLPASCLGDPDKRCPPANCASYLFPPGMVQIPSNAKRLATLLALLCSSYPLHLPLMSSVHPTHVRLLADVAAQHCILLSFLPLASKASLISLIHLLPSHTVNRPFIYGRYALACRRTRAGYTRLVSSINSRTTRPRNTPSGRHPRSIFKLAAQQHH